MSAREDTVGGPRIVVVHEPDDASDSSVYEGTSEEEDTAGVWQESKSSDLPSEYWHIQKLVKYMKAGNQTATIVALACLKDHDLTTEINQMAIRDIGGLEVLINLLETDDFKCKMGALSVLSEISSNLDIRKHITDLGAVPLLVNLLSDPARDLQGLAAFTISNVAKIRKARKIVRKCSGLPKLVDLLDVKPSLLLTPISQLEQDDRKRIDVVHGSAKAIWSLSQSNKNKEAMRRTGCIKLLARLLQSVHEEIVVFTVGTIQQCASQSKYQLAIQAEGMIGDMVRYLSSPNIELKKHCASAIFKCAEDSVTRDMVRQHGGLDPLVAIIKDEDVHLNKPLLAAATGAIWKCAISIENVRRLDDLNTVNILVGLLSDEDEEVLTNIVGALAQCAKLGHNREAIRLAGGIQPLVMLLNLANQALLENVAKCLGECAHQADCLSEMEKMDAIRLFWSLLKNPSPKVQANAAWALVPCIEHAKDSGEIVRSFVGGLELIVNLLQSEDVRVLACVCAALANVAKDRENLAVITDHGVVPMLARLVLTEDDTLREHLASAIANCCSWSNNCYEFGRLGAVTPLVGYMMSKERRVHRTTALALCQLSQDPFNCVTLHQSGVVPYLLKTIGSPDEVLQEASAGCLSNIRKLALASDRAKY
ncbi:LOW QUALITY PROTEIN: armadillo repeat-containing protein gudu-like [Homalodisca vitripennis]|uniref:LOW QUALITY PROTEIN: armadillo repeat-containing protein gudu-like n=1 Tax=Homalodisca vitripennis TaxID=197043 RepID=UPI001EEB5450|nr:LOW QUALITY PROTEIN: armadillo repeat-containing protein gudu-like [Homalodisca vitripennis]